VLVGVHQLDECRRFVRRLANVSIETEGVTGEDDHEESAILSEMSLRIGRGSASHVG
jgi:hypothetical protein